MTDLIISDSNITKLEDAYTVPAPSKKEVSNDSAFQQILSCLLLSSMSNASSQSGDIGSLISPLMLLLEQMQYQQFTSQPTLEQSFSSSATVSGANSYYDHEILRDCAFPVEGKLTQHFNGDHHGLDFSVPVGTPVRSTMEGKVVFAGMSSAGYGNLVVVQNGNYKTYYGHLYEIPVSLNQTIQKGEVIGLSGNTGKSSGPHVHYEVRYNNSPFDPNNFDSSNLYEQNL